MEHEKGTQSCVVSQTEHGVGNRHHSLLNRQHSFSALVQCCMIYIKIECKQHEKQTWEEALKIPMHFIASPHDKVKVWHTEWAQNQTVHIFSKKQ